MQRSVGHFRAIVSRVLFIGVSAQILLGLLWMLLALDGRQDFGTNAYMEWLDRLFPGVSFEPVVYAVQLSIAFWAGYQLLEGLGVRGKKWRVWGSLALLTYPYAMQCHVAVLPDSLAFSAFLLLLAAGLKKNKSIYFYWIVSAFFLPEYFYFGLVPAAVYFFVSVKETKLLKKRLVEVMLFTMVLVLSAGMQKEAGTLNEDKLATAWFRRTAWSTMSHFYAHWPEEVRSAVAEEEYNVIRRLPDKVEEVLWPKVENILGEEAAVKWMTEFGAFVVKESGQQVIKDIAKDAGGYLFPGVFVQLRLDGKGGSSYCVRNYEIMRQDHPRVTGCYIQYASWWFVIGTLGTVLLWLSRYCDKDPVNKGGSWKQKNGWWIWGAFPISGLLMTVWYTFWTAGLWDPKKALFVGIIWILVTLRNIVWYFEKNENDLKRFKKR